MPKLSLMFGVALACVSAAVIAIVANASERNFEGKVSTEGSRFVVTQANNLAVLADGITGDTWVLHLSVATEQHVWLPVNRRGDEKAVETYRRAEFEGCKQAYEAAIKRLAEVHAEITSAAQSTDQYTLDRLQSEARTLNGRIIELHRVVTGSM